MEGVINMVKNVDVNTQSSIRIEAERIIYSDPLEIAGAPHDADIILITHDHYDHFSPADIEKAGNSDTVLILPEKMKDDVKKLSRKPGQVILVKPDESLTVCGIPIETVPAYNVNKKFHPKESSWTGYILTLGNTRYYISGDTDNTEDARRVKCDVAMVPIGGTYTMDPKEAAELINTISPIVAIPTHYGSIVGKPGDAKTFRKFVKPEIDVEVKL